MFSNRTHDHFDDGVDGVHLCGTGAVHSGEVLPVFQIRGNDRQPGLLRQA